MASWERLGLPIEREPVAATGKQSRVGEWSVREHHLRRFVIENVALIDFRKVDKFWLVDLLTSGSPSKGDSA